jgi:hypothetical protein
MDLAPFFRETTLGRPATYTNAAGSSKEIIVVPEISESNSSIGDTQVNSNIITVHAKTEDVSDATNDASLRIHDIMVDEDGKPYTDEDGTQFQVEGKAAYNIQSVFNDENGLTVLSCSKE